MTKEVEVAVFVVYERADNTVIPEPLLGLFPTWEEAKARVKSFLGEEDSVVMGWMEDMERQKSVGEDRQDLDDSFQTTHVAEIECLPQHYLGVAHYWMTTTTD